MQNLAILEMKWINVLLSFRFLPPACPGAGRWGHTNWSSVLWGKNMLDKNLLYRHYKPKETTKEGTPSFVLHKSTFASVSKTVSIGAIPLRSLWVRTKHFSLFVHSLHVLYCMLWELDADVRLDLVRDSALRIASATMSPSPSPARMQACRITSHICV